MSGPNFITPFGDKKPEIHPEAFVDVSARIIGEVSLSEGSSVWPLAVLRADSGRISLGRRAAVLDLALVEAPGGREVLVGDEAIISHGAMVHGAVVEKRALVGVGAVVLDGAVIGAGSIVGAGAVVTPGARIPPASLVLGMPGRVVRPTTEQERRTLLAQVEELFVKSRQYMKKRPAPSASLW
ncbi:MAG: gamma carbonic anhydrase family protein [Thermodesulfobacteriota bacterium]